MDDKRQIILREFATPECENGSTPWCNPTNYPAKAMTNIIKKDRSLVKLLEMDEHPLLPVRNTEQENICQTATDYIYPKAAMNKEGKFMFIVNRPEGSEEYLQLVKVTTCKDAGEECAQGQLLGSGISTTCRQEYADHKLVALSHSGE